MRNLTNALYSVAQIRAIEASARKSLKSDKSLMELAGQEAYSCLRQCWPSVSRVVVLCGGGNNGGDGFVLARLAQNAGLSVCLVLAAKPSTSEAEEALNKAYQKIQKKIHPDISPETSKLSSIVNEAKEVVLKDLS